MAQGPGGSRNFAKIGAAIVAVVLLAVGAWYVFVGKDQLGPEMVFHRGNGAEPETLDIHKMTGVTEQNIAQDLYEGLTAFAANGDVIPGAAESWTVSDDGLIYDFKLRADGKWSNGDAVSAADFVFGIRRCLDPNTASDYAYLLYPIKGAAAFNGGEATDPASVGVEALDDLTVRITLEAPTPYFTQMLIFPPAYPLHRASFEQHGDEFTKPGNLIGNGAFTLAEWVPQDRIKLVKNPNYHDAANVQLDTVYMYPTEDLAAELNRFRAGELDATYDAPSDQIPWIEENLAAEFHNTPYLGVYYYAFNMTVDPFKDNLKLRQALAYAIDRETLTSKITLGGELPAYNWVPPGVSNYTAQATDWADLTQDQRNEMAKQLYAEAGYSADNPLQLEILYNTSDNHKKIAIAVAGMWQQVLGIQATLRNEEWKVYLESRDQKQFQVVRAGWIGDYNDANTFLDINLSDVGDINTSGYANADYDAAVKGAASESDMTKRRDLLEAAERQFNADLPAIPIYHYSSQHLVLTYVVGWEDNILDYHPERWISVQR
ncbi:MAG: peptide ABC transporter substrate-binding protein [Alphaproteobacteria bacterium]|nr:peptide ABC transporter substrate-binding protein [Alphaproteobacteria bacterium]